MASGLLTPWYAKFNQILNLDKAGIRVNTQPIWGFQPRVGIGYEFPMNQAAREELRWGILFSYVFEL